MDISGKLETMFYFFHFFFFSNGSGLGSSSNTLSSSNDVSAALTLLPGKLSVMHKRHYSLLQRDPSCQSSSVVKYIPCIHNFLKPFNGSMNLKRISIGSQCSEWLDNVYKTLPVTDGKEEGCELQFP